MATFLEGSAKNPHCNKPVLQQSLEEAASAGPSYVSSVHNVLLFLPGTPTRLREWSIKVAS